MPSQITNYQCPSCSGPLRYDGKSGALVCDYCGRKYTVSEIESYYSVKDQQAVEAQAAAEEREAESSEENSEWDLSSITGNWGEEGEVRQYNCPSCGAQLILDATTAATSCPYCANPTIVPSQLTGSLKPDYVIPFKYDKKQAISALKDFYKGKFFLPKAFHDENHIDEIKGLYAPFWLYDGKIAGDLVFHATRVSSYRAGNEEVTTTDHYTVNRSGMVAFEHVPADGSSKLPDPHMDSIEPYDYSELKPFSTGYLPGYMADKYDIDAMSQIDRIASRERNTVRTAISRTVTGYSTASIQSERYRVIPGKVHYALLPVWLLVTNWRGDKYVFAMNGQTGKLIGDLPVDKGKFWLTAFLGANAVALIAMILSFFM